MGPRLGDLYLAISRPVRAEIFPKILFHLEDLSIILEYRMQESQQQ
jgi:hypothetical protein